jgi:hypothetical protein
MAEGRYVTASLKVSRDSREKDLVRLAVEEAEGNISRAGAELGDQ